MNQRLRLEKEDHGEVLDDGLLASMFWRSFTEDFDTHRDSEIYHKISNEHNSVNFEVDAFRGHRRGLENDQITVLDEPKIIADVLKIAQGCRLINMDVYEIVNELRLDGEYIIAFQGKPAIRVIGVHSDDSRWVSRPSRFESYDGKNFLSHIPHLPRREVDLELSITGEDNRAPLERTYRKALEFYKGEGYGIAEQIESAQAG